MKWTPTVLLAALAVGALAWHHLDPAAAKGPNQAPAAQPAPAGGLAAAIKKLTDDYVKAFNAQDAKAAAALWTAEGEYIDPDGEAVTGRAAIEKGLAETSKANPKARVEIDVETVRALGRGTAASEGVVRRTTAGEKSATVTRYSALHVQEDGAWRTASVREWITDPTLELTPKHLDWLIGDWAAKGEGGELKITYAWDEAKAFLRGTYSLTKDGSAVSSGTHVLGRNAAGGVRSWTFDSSGTTVDGLWVKDDERWVNEATGVLPDGTEITSVNVLIRLGPDAFTWQTTDREANGVPLPALPPVKVTRAKAGK